VDANEFLTQNTSLKNCFTESFSDIDLQGSGSGFDDFQTTKGIRQPLPREDHIVQPLGAGDASSRLTGLNVGKVGQSLKTCE
jgi:hypothetical protein